jgi:hypothetical protein
MISAGQMPAYCVIFGAIQIQDMDVVFLGVTNIQICEERDILLGPVREYGRMGSSVNLVVVRTGEVSELGTQFAVRCE